MKKIEELKTYEIIEQKHSKDIYSDMLLLRHKKTGARVVLIQNDDNNKVFYIGFRTPPKDSTGVAHILEHSVLCGSKNFPVKDPFVELVKGSLNTFLNAMTYPDKTVYPVASCNEKDFQNLMHVYLDAVLYPNIYTEDKIFKQEGWHYELEELENKLTINGVVYNEMKGAFSAPDDILDREVFNSLFPDTAYGVESGGHPDAIPNLTYEDFLAFHGKYYHPSNSYIYLYGDMDMAEKLEWIDAEYLSKFEAISVDSVIKTQQTFSAPVESVKEYSITQGESPKDNTYLSYNTIVENSLDKELYIAFQILDYALCTAPGAVLKQALLDKGIGKDIYSIYENGIYQPYFSIVAKGTNKEQKEEFVQTIETILEKCVKEGIDKKALQAGINCFEFKYREADFGSYPKGLMYGLQALDSWLYDDYKPFIHLEANETFRILREKVETNYFELLVKKYIVENQHRSLVMVVPVKDLTRQADKELEQRLKEYKDSLKKEELEKIKQDTQELLAYQEEENSKEELEKIPMLKRVDLKKEAEDFCNQERKVGDTKVLFHPVCTNGISYIKMIFKANALPKEYIPYVGILKAVFCYMDTKNYAYGDLYNEINIQTGGIGSNVNTYVNAKKLEEFLFTFEVKTKTLYKKIPNAFSLMEEIIMTSKVEDTKRLYEIIVEMKSRMQANMFSAGHSLAAVRAMSYFSPAARVSELTGGVPFYRLLEDLETNFEEKKEKLIICLKETMTYIFRKENMLVDITSEEEGYKEIPTFITNFSKNLYEDEIKKETFVIETKKCNEGLTTSAQVQYVCNAGNFLKKGLPYTGALRALKVILGYEYLWNNIRVKGGAYGCMCNFGKTGDSYFVSYRDPNLLKTIEVYRKTPEFLRKFTADERTITKFIIGAISDLDTPLTPSTKGSRSLGAYLSNLSFEEIQKERDELLAVDCEDIKKMADYVEAILSDQCICVVGNEDKIKENETLFDTIENLFH